MIRNPCLACGSVKCMYLDPEQCRSVTENKPHDHFRPSPDTVYMVSVERRTEKSLFGTATRYEGRDSLQAPGTQKYEVELSIGYVPAEIRDIKAGESFIFEMNTTRGLRIERIRPF